MSKFSKVYMIIKIIKKDKLLLNLHIFVTIVKTLTKRILHPPVEIVHIATLPSAQEHTIIFAAVFIAIDKQG